MPSFLLFALLVFDFSLSFGQLGQNRVLKTRLRLDTADSRKLFLGVNMLGFVKDNEYDKLPESRHLPVTHSSVYQLNPYLS